MLLAISGCKRNSPEIPPGLLASRASQEAGRKLFVENCAICHGAKGDGRGSRQMGLNPPPADLTTPTWSDAMNAGRIFAAIRDGVPGSAMPSWRILSDEQIWDLVAYVHSLGQS